MAALDVITFGCRLNSYESEIMRDHARHRPSRAPTVIVNTCAVTAEAERQARQAIRRARRARPEARIVVTGCAAQINPDRFAAMPEVDQVLGNQEKLAPLAFAEPAPTRVLVNDIMAVTETAAHLVPGFDGRARAFVQVQNGCDHRCTFCVIPYGRGPSRSVPLGAIVAETRKLVADGYKEIVLTGVDITSYGGDLPGKPGLGQLVRRLLKAVPDLPQLRLSSLDPAAISADLIDAFAAQPRLMPHIHMSVQSGDDLILKRMKRRHSRADVIALCARLREARPAIVFGADIIAGFPTESDAMFSQTEDLLARCGFIHLHVFPYSPRPDTAAARMPQVARALARRRATCLRAFAETALARHARAQIGQTTRVLVEKDRRARTRDYLPVQLVAPRQDGSLVDAHIVDAVPDHLIAIPL